MFCFALNWNQSPPPPPPYLPSSLNTICCFTECASWIDIDYTVHTKGGIYIDIDYTVHTKGGIYIDIDYTVHTKGGIYIKHNSFKKLNIFCKTVNS